MTRRPLSPDLTPEAGRYLDRIRSLRPPVDLVEHVMVEVEATSQERFGFAGLPRPLLFAAGATAVAAAVIAVAVLLRPAPPNVGPQTTPTPSTAEQSSLDQLPPAGQVVNRTAINYTGVEFDRVARFFAHGYLWLDDADNGQGTASGELVRVDPATGAVDTLDVTGRIGFELSATADESSIWALDNFTSEFVEIDPERLAEVRRIRARTQVGDFAVAGGIAWFEDVLTNDLVRLDLSSGAEDWRVTRPAPSRILIDGDTLWVGQDDGVLSRLDAVTGVVEEELETRVVAFSMANAGDAILIYGGIGGLARVDKSTGAVDIVNAREPGDDIPADGIGAPMSADGRVWSTTTASGHLVELDPASLEPIAALQVGLTTFHGLVAGDDALWAVGSDSAGETYIIEIAPAP